MSGDRLQFENNSWDIIIVDKILESRLMIRTFNNQTYFMNSDNKEQKIGVILDFIQYIEIRCKLVVRSRTVSFPSMSILFSNDPS